MRAIRPPTSREVPILRQTDRQTEASTECRSAKFPQFSSLSGPLPAGDPHRLSPPATATTIMLTLTVDTSVAVTAHVKNNIKMAAQLFL